VSADVNVRLVDADCFKFEVSDEVELVNWLLLIETVLATGADIDVMSMLNDFEWLSLF
jgi:hypothetical protein